VGVRLLGLKPAEQETLLSHLLWDYVAGLPMTTPDAQRALRAARKEHAFHWPFEFPEVFATEGRGGFSAFIGNPPFRGGTRISSVYGVEYLNFLQESFPSFVSRSDLCALFFLQAIKMLNIDGKLGLIATNTIAQADTKEAGLDEIVKKGGDIYSAYIDLRWPGQAAVMVSVIHISKCRYKGTKYLDSKKVEVISTKLNDEVQFTKPFKLIRNSSFIFSGSKLDGEGFVLTQTEAEKIISTNNIYTKVLFPYLRGDDFNSRPDQKPTYWVINFFDWDYETASKFPLCLEILRDRVYADRQKHSEKRARDFWWQFQRTRAELYKVASTHNQVLFHPFTSKYLSFGFVPSNYVFAAPHVVVTLPFFDQFCVLQSTIHETWVVSNGSTLGTTLRYTTSDVLETFPFPYNNEISVIETGEKYHTYRRDLMAKNSEGITTTYNRFHNPKEKSTDIVRLRELHIEMDNAVAVAYGWSDLDLGHGFHETPQGMRFTISETARREVLTRLLQLNHERYEEEVRQGQHEKDKKKAKEEQPTRQKPKKLAQPEGQMNLLAEPDIPEVTADAETLSATPTAEIGSWDRCKCLVCDKTVMGFSITEHTQSEHQGKDPGYRKI